MVSVMQTQLGMTGAVGCFVKIARVTLEASGYASGDFAILVLNDKDKVVG
jgi:hypothetical protein